MKKINSNFNPFDSKKVIYHAKYWEPIADGYMPPPVLVTLDPINKCNFNCKYCNAAFKMKNSSQQYSDYIIDNVAAFLKNWGVKAVCCSPPGEKIICRDSIKNIENISINDFVRGSDGNYYSVARLFYKNIDNELLYTIKCDGFGIPSTFTGEHKILLSDMSLKPVSQISINDSLMYPFSMEEKDVQFFKLDQYKYREGPRSKITNKLLIPCNEDFLYIFGWFVAEGSFNGKRSLVWTFGPKDEKFFDKFVSICKNLFGIVPKKNDKWPNHNKIEFVINSKLLYFLFNDLCGTGAKNKSLHKDITLLPISKQMSLLKGIFLGDGCFRDRKFGGSQFSNSSIHYKTISPSLASQVRDILLRFGIVPSISVEYPGGNRQPSYQVSVYGKNSRFLINKIFGIELPGNKILECSHLQNKIVSYNNSYYVKLKIKSITKKLYSGSVYNFEVSDNHKYVGLSFCVSNCAGGGEPLLHKRFGDLIKNLYKENIQIGVVTNGSLIHNFIEELSLCKWIGISVDAGNSESFSKLKNVKSSMFEKAILNISNLRSHNKDLEITYKFLAHPDNITSIYEAIGLAKQIGCNYFHLRPCGKTWDNLNQPNIFSKLDISLAGAQILQAKEDFEDENFKIFGILNKFSKNWDIEHNFKTCHAVAMTAVIEPNNQVGLCCDRRGDSRTVLGMFDKLEEILVLWNSKKHWEILNSIKLSDCPRCTYGLHNQIFEHFILNDDVCKNFI